jgi:hypothetical protein
MKGWSIAAAAICNFRLLQAEAPPARARNGLTRSR